MIPQAQNKPLVVVDFMENADYIKVSCQSCGEVAQIPTTGTVTLWGKRYKDKLPQRMVDRQLKKFSDIHESNHPSWGKD